jgi:hypothetical protein
MLRELLARPDIQEVLLELGLPLLTALGGLITHLLFRLFRRLGVELSEAETKLVLQLRDAGSAYAEEYARAKLKGGEIVGGEEKRKIAIDIVRELAGGRLKKWSDDKIGAVVESGLPELRARLSVAPPAPGESLAVPTAVMPRVSPELLAQLKQR